MKALEGKRVCEIDARAIKDYQKARQKQVSNRTINLEVKVLRQVLRAAKVWNQIAEDHKTLPENNLGPGRSLDSEQEKLLLDTARSNPDWDAAFLAALAASNTTMRGYELKVLRLCDVNLIDEEVAVRKSKTSAGERVIPLNGAAKWAFARLLERANLLGSLEPHHFLFLGFRYQRRKLSSAPQRGGYDPERHQKTWRTAWRSLLKETAKRAGNAAYNAAVEAGSSSDAAEKERGKQTAPFIGFRFHDLRHCAITKLAESDRASDQTIMSIAGHLSRKMLEHYSHIRAQAKRHAVQAIVSYNPETETHSAENITVQ